MKKMTENEIIERLETLVKNGFPFCADALNLINHLKELDKKNENIIRLADKTIKAQSAEIEKLNAEIERLQEENKNHKSVIEAIEDTINPLPFETDFDKAIKTAKSEAIKEFEYRITMECAKVMTIFQLDVMKEIIEDVKQEMVGDDNA